MSPRDQTMNPPKIEHGIPKPPSREELDQRDNAELFRFMTENPQYTHWDIAKELGWVSTTGVGAGNPDVMRVRKALKRLRREGKLR
jgi:hypothetical protein